MGLRIDDCFEQPKVEVDAPPSNLETILSAATDLVVYSLYDLTAHLCASILTSAAITVPRNYGTSATRKALYNEFLDMVRSHLIKDKEGAEEEQGEANGKEKEEREVR